MYRVNALVVDLVLLKDVASPLAPHTWEHGST